MSSYFSEVIQGPPIAVFSLNKAFMDDTFERKVNLGIGAYRTNEGKPWVLPVVRKVEKLLAEDDSLNHEYLPVLGMQAFCEAATQMLLGKNCKPLVERKAFGIQSLSGTGALRVGAAFLKSQLNLSTVYVSDPTWENHFMLFKHSGFSDVRTYRYWNLKTKGINFDGFCEDLRNAPEKSVVVFHACAHNPTGCDPNEEQWKTLSKIVKERKLFPFFDCAYQGFASGNLEKDSWAVRYFANEGHELFCSQSFAKNFGLYNERIGNLTVIVNDASKMPSVKSQFELIVRGMYSNPPCHGARIVSTVLSVPEYYEEWISCIREMSQRILKMRKELREKLESRTEPGMWKYITDQIGMFSYTDISEEEVEILKTRYHIYLLKSGRINICGLNTHNIDYVVDCIYKTISETRKL